MATVKSDTPKDGVDERRRGAALIDFIKALGFDINTVQTIAIEPWDITVATNGVSARLPFWFDREYAKSEPTKPIRQTYRVELSDHDRALLQRIIDNSQRPAPSVIPKQGQYTATWTPSTFTVNHAGETPGIDIRDLEKEVRYLRARLVDNFDLKHRITLLEEDMENLKVSE